MERPKRLQRSDPLNVARRVNHLNVLNDYSGDSGLVADCLVSEAYSVAVG
jgi:hypothetical protein